jgi:guanylate kinase
MMNLFQIYFPIRYFSIGGPSGYFSESIFKRLDKDREEREKKTAKRKEKSKSEVKAQENITEVVTDDAYIPGAF